MPSRSRSTSSTAAAPLPDDTAVPFEEALRELEEITQALDGGSQGLDELVTQYERGMGLLALCQRQLDTAQLRIEQISRKADGGLETAPFPAAGPSPSPAPAGDPSGARPLSSSPADHDENDEIRLF